MEKEDREKIMDVKSPGKSVPQPTARPVIGNHPMMTSDPMMVPPSSPDASPPSSEGLAKHAEKTIEPISEMIPADNDDKDESATTGTETELKEDESSKNDTAVVDEEPDEVEADGPPAVSPIISKDGGMRDPEAEKTKAEAAALEVLEERQTQLEELIITGKYTVPIGTRHKNRGRLYTMIFVIIVIVLVVVLLDVLLDSGLLKLSINIPHTNLLSK